MNKTLYISIDTTLDYTVECPKLVKRGDILKLQIKVFTDGVLRDLTGQNIDIILQKSDGTLIENTIDIANISNGVVTAILDVQATVVAGLVSGELQLSDESGQESTNTFTFQVNSSLADDVIEVSKDDINTLNQLRDLIATGEMTITEYETHILTIANSIEAIEALGNIKSYIDVNLAALQQENAEAVVNNNNLQTKNSEAITNQAALEQAIEEANEFVANHGDIIDLDNRVDLVESQLSKNTEQISNMSINLKDFGAVGDGEAHTISSILPNVTLSEVQSLNSAATLEDSVDWYAFQKAINSIPYNNTDMNANVGNKIVVPSGKYNISRTIIVKSPIHFIGNSGCGGVSIVSNNAIDYFSLEDATASARFKFENIRFRYLKNNCSGVISPVATLDSIFISCWFEGWGSTTAKGIKGKFTNCIVSHCYFENNEGIVLDTSAYELIITNNIFYKCNTYGIYLIGVNPATYQQSKCIISNNLFEIANAIGLETSLIYASGYKQLIISNNHFMSDSSTQTNRFVRLENCFACIIQGNVMSYFQQHAIYLNNCYSCNVVGNIISDNPTGVSVSGIYSIGGVNNNISCNSFFKLNNGGATSNCIIVSGETSSHIINNIMKESGNGINLTGATTGCVVKDNTINSSVTTPINNTSTGGNNVNYKDNISNVGDSNLTLTDASKDVQIFNVTLTGNRSVTLPTANYIGREFKIIHSASDAYSIDVGGIKNLTQNAWIHIKYDGSAWRIVGYGSL